MKNHRSIGITPNVSPGALKMYLCTVRHQRKDQTIQRVGWWVFNNFWQLSYGSGQWPRVQFSHAIKATA